MAARVRVFHRSTRSHNAGLLRKIRRIVLKVEVVPIRQFVVISLTSEPSLYVRAFRVRIFVAALHQTLFLYTLTEFTSRFGAVHLNWAAPYWPVVYMSTHS